MNRLIKNISLLLLFLLSSEIIKAQCAMCKAVIESESESGGAIAESVNSGILYLMFFPYLLVSVVGYFIYKNYIKKSANTN
ncbi:MAG: hypothetical protein OQJ96_03995 [Flavobacteriales bacterium]|nr:hypothetical protein [Flavobacteriales bacterium]MCW8912521.1 hypothetical protein [Flavobacteriales bacterium]MCW8936605.1 hypothetical protein [Flavobacteriales bacterium]MCW8941341.1 hypothetical protein [Flavobacteriales bacterium]MCW8968059.1 hypothetical protein [Flavobacteriales bacterium]